MKEKLLTMMRVLLVAAGLGVGANCAWADAITTHSWTFTGLDANTAITKSETSLTESGTTCNLATAPSCCEGLYFNEGWQVYKKSDSNPGLRNISNGDRMIIVPNLKKGDIITITGNADAINNINTTPSTGTKDEVNNTLTYTMSADGNFYFKMVKSGGKVNDVTVYPSIKSIVVTHNYANLITKDFENAETYSNGWTVSNTTTSQLDISGNKKILFRTNKDKSQSTETYDFSSVVKGTTADYSLSFDYAFTPTGGSQIQTPALPVLEVYAGATKLLYIECGGSGGSGVTMSVKNASGTTIGSLTSQSRFSNPGASNFYTFTIIGNSTDGTTLSIKDSSGEVVTLSNSTLNASYKLADKIVSNLHKTSGQNNYPSLAAFDNIVFKAELENLKSRATTVTTAYTAIKDEIMNSTVYSTLDGAHTTLAAFSDDASIMANGGGYLAAIIALENAIPDAEESAADFKMLNQLIANANSSAPAGYEAPSGATTVYTANADVDAATLITAVRTAITTAGVANENTDITALIINSSFELGNTYGWTTVASNDTGARGNSSPYTTSGIDGSWQFNTWSQGTPITQNIGTLPEGQYKLACKVSSDGATMYLTMNDSHSSGTVTSDGATYIDAEYTFSLGEPTEVTIGAVGGDGDGNYIADGHWWYKADKFTLTYLGEDPLEKAKADLNNEIDAATTVKNAWTPKVGTAPFKYASTYYDVLVSELDDAATVAASGSTTVSDYTTAMDELETAKDNMSSSVQNLPDPEKYYRIFVANNDGTASDYNLNMLKETTKTQVTVTSAPYPVRFDGSGTIYTIYNPYDHYLCTDSKNATKAYVSSGEGVEARASSLAFTIQPNGSVRINGSKNGTSYYYSASASEGSGVTAPTSVSGTWVVSDPVDVTNVTLSVNATAGWGTFIAPYDNLTPSTVKAYTVSYTENNVVYLTENETGVLSANTPYILSTEEAENVSTTFKGIANNDDDTYEVNGLVGLLTASTVPSNSYILQYNNSQIGFYKTTSSITGTANRCYLDLASVPTSASSRTSISFNIYDGETTGVSASLMNNEESIKNGEVYDLQGRKVTNPTKGLYIVNGMKVNINK